MVEVPDFNRINKISSSMKVHLLFLPLLVFLAIQTQGYAQRIDLDDLRSRFPGEDAVILTQKEHVFIEQDAVSGELNVWVKSEEDRLILNANNIALSNDAIFYTSFSEIRNIDAQTLIPVSRNKYRAVPVTDIEEQDVMESGIFYSDYKRKMIIYPAVENGAVLHLGYEEHLNDLRMLTPFYFDSFAPVLEAEYAVTFPASVTVAHLIYGQNKNLASFQEQTENGYTTYTWRAANVPKFIGEDNAPSKSYYSPHVIVRIQQYLKRGETVNVLHDVQDLYRWYDSLVKQIPEEDETEVKAMTNEIISGIDNDYEKARAIFNWVQTNIQYIAFEDGMGGFIPRPAPSVCTRRYGDCKDMANLLRRMLNYAGLDAYLTWIGTRSKPYAYAEVPMPIVDNHMITALALDGQTYFLDATGKYTPFPLPTPMIQGKEAMIGIDDDQFEIREVPVVEKEQNLLVDSSWLEIRNGDLIGRASRYAGGFFQLDLDAQRNLIEENDTGKFWNGYLLKGNNKFALTGFSAQAVSTGQQGGVSIPYDFELPGYVRSVGNRMLINMHLSRRLQGSNIDTETRRFDRSFEFRYIHRDVNTLQLPEGYEVGYLPKSIEYQDDRFGFRIQYNQRQDQIILEKEIYINTLLLKKTDFADWNEMIGQLVDAYREVVVLSKKS